MRRAEFGALIERVLPVLAAPLERRRHGSAPRERLPAPRGRAGPESVSAAPRGARIWTGQRSWPTTSSGSAFSPADRDVHARTISPPDQLPGSPPADPRSPPGRRS
jgi:hypothetical protein